jgi:TonB family protein
MTRALQRQSRKVYLLAAALQCALLAGCETVQPSSAPVSAALDAAGGYHSAREYPKDQIPWLHGDVVRDVTPEYPAWQFSRHQGEGLFRVSLDLRSGAVTRESIVKSTGFRELDESAVAALSKWRWKPGRWKEIEIPIRFQWGVASRHERLDIPHTEEKRE